MKATKAQTRATLPAVVIEAVQATADHKDWAKRLTSTIRTAANLGNKLLTLVLEARDNGIPEAYVRDTIKQAYIDTGSSPESARKRACDALAVYKSDTPANELPKNLQEASAAVRKAKAGTQRAPRTPTGPGESEGDDEQGVRELSPLQMIEAGLRAMQKQYDDVDLLLIVNDMMDLAGELAELVANVQPEKAVN